MADVIVTVPKHVWNAWLAEGDLPDEAATGDEYAYWLGGSPPHMRPGDRVYICAHGKLRGNDHAGYSRWRSLSWARKNRDARAAALEAAIDALGMVKR